MKFKRYIVWILGTLVAVASVDAIPDPPAVSPHTITVTSRLDEVRDEACVSHLTFDYPCTSFPLPIFQTSLVSDYEPNLPSDRIVLTGRAANSSPPAFLVRSL